MSTPVSDTYRAPLEQTVARFGNAQSQLPVGALMLGTAVIFFGSFLSLQ